MSLAIRDRLGLVVERDHAGDRAEDLLAGGAVVVGDRREHGRREPVAGAVGRRAADRDRRVVVDVRGDRLALVGGDQRPHLRSTRRAGRRPRSRSTALLERRHELVHRRALDQDPRARAAVLAGVAEDRAAAPPRRPPRGRRRRRSTFADLPPSSSVTRLIVCGGARGDPAADLGRAGEGDLGDVGVLDQALPADRARARRRR